MNYENLVVNPLSADFTISSFDCGDSDLNDFILSDAKGYLSELLAVTYLLFDKSESERVIGYFSLLNDKISYIPEERSLWNRLNRNVVNAKRRKHYPSVKIGRLAVDSDFSGIGVGQILIDTIKYMFTHGNRTGCRFITVDAYQAAVPFYLKSGFDFFTTKDANEPTRLMFYDLKKYTTAYKAGSW